MVPQSGQAKPDDALKVVEAIKPESCDVDVSVALPDTQQPAGYTYRRLPLDTGLGDAFRGILGTAKRTLVPTSSKSVNHVLVPFDFDRHQQSHEIEYIDLLDQDFSVIANAVAPLNGSIAPPDLSAEELSDNSGRFSYYGSVFRHSGSQVVAIKKFDARMLVQRKRLVARFLDSSGLTEIHEPVIAFDNLIDGLVVGNMLLIFNRTSLFNAFGFFQILEQKARSGFDGIRAVLPLKDEDALLEFMAKSHPMRLKLAKIARSPYLEQITLADIRRTLSKFPDLKMAVVDDENGQPVLDWHQAGVWKLLNLFADDYLVSEMTGGGYEASGKSLIAVGRKNS